jgi:glycopeptide antibiotics resistance protein
VWGKLALGSLVGCAFLILAETVLIRKPFSGQHFNPEFFWSWRQWKIQRNQILTNVIMFAPIGVLTGHLWKWKGLWVSAGLSIAIELLQFITARGLCEFDDVFHNVIGAVIGIGVVMIGRKLEYTIRRIAEKNSR